MADDAHIPVLLQEVLAALEVRPDGIYFDGTFGRGGHSREILQRLGPEGRLYACDRDATALAAGADLAGDPRVTLVHGRFSAAGRLLEQAGVSGRLDGALLDLGVSSPQLDQAGRGFSFQQDGPLDMRMDQQHGPTAAEWLASVPQAELEHCLRELGEERFWRRIARRLCERRVREPILTTGQLAALVAGAVPRTGERIHPATRTFQALRIAVNDELGELSSALSALRAALAPGGRLCVISFHSLEDRLVKRDFRDAAKAPETSITGVAPFRVLTRKPVTPSDAECARNPRSRSAKLRVLERAA